jgi:hypothetical protein
VDPQPEPNQATWAKLSITVERSDGGIVDAELIRPRAWIRSVGIEAGKLLPINIEELQVKGSATVTSIDDCPEIADGEGSVVTARFITREVHVVASVDIQGPDGSIETITGTPIHPIWSVARQEWIPLGELIEGDTLQGFDGLAIVLGLSITTVAKPVYNIEVHGEHVYEIGTYRLLVHNACVYRAFDEAGNVIYVGITKSFPRRYAEHLKTKGIEIIKLTGDLSGASARGVEQALINTYGLGKDGGTLLNKINSIALSNPMYSSAVADGLQILKNLGIGI